MSKGRKNPKSSIKPTLHLPRKKPKVDGKKKTVSKVADSHGFSFFKLISHFLESFIFFEEKFTFLVTELEVSGF